MKRTIRLTESDLHRIIKESMTNILNEIGDTKDGQRILGRTAERAHQRAARTSGADARRYKKTFNDAYSTATRSSNKHFGGTGKYFDQGRDDEYDKWEKEHNGNVAESYLHNVVKESVNRILKEGYNQFSDSDFGSDGDPYGFFDDEELDYSLNGFYSSFNHIWVDIKNDGKPNAHIMVGSNMDNQTKEFEGEEAQRMLDKIRRDADSYEGNIHIAMYNNLYKYVL